MSVGLTLARPVAAPAAAATRATAMPLSFPPLRTLASSPCRRGCPLAGLALPRPWSCDATVIRMASRGSPPSALSEVPASFSWLVSLCQAYLARLVLLHRPLKPLRFLPSREFASAVLTCTCRIPIVVGKTVFFCIVQAMYVARRDAHSSCHLIHLVRRNVFRPQCNRDPFGRGKPFRAQAIECPS